MDLSTVGEVIATRSLNLADEKDRVVVVLIGRPRQFPDSTDYYCPFQITGIGSERVKYAGGVDPVQALQLALLKAGADLYALDRKTGGRLRWDGGEPGDLGFPKPD